MTTENKKRIFAHKLKIGLISGAIMGTVFFGMQYMLDKWNESNKVTPQKLTQLMMNEDKKKI